MFQLNMLLTITFITIPISFVVSYLLTRKSPYRTFMLSAVLVFLIGATIRGVVSFAEHKQVRPIRETSIPGVIVSGRSAKVEGFQRIIQLIYQYFNSTYQNPLYVTTPWHWPRNLPTSFKANTVGGVNGLLIVCAHTGMYGCIGPIRCMLYPGSGKIVVPSSVQPDFKEQIINAFNLLVSSAAKYGINSTKLNKFDIYIELPSLVNYYSSNLSINAVEDSSMGTAIFIALLSAFTKCPVRSDIVMTGTLTAEGLIKKIGGLKEKTIAAREAGIFKVLCPLENMLEAKNFCDVEFVFCKTIDDVVKNAFSPKDLVNMKKDIPLTPASKAKELADKEYVKVLEKRDALIPSTLLEEFMSVKLLYEKAAALYEKKGDKKAAAECVEMLAYITKNEEYIHLSFKSDMRASIANRIKLYERAALLYDAMGNKRAAAEKMYIITSNLRFSLQSFIIRNDFSSISIDSLVAFSKRAAECYMKIGDYNYAAQSLKEAALGLRFYTLANVCCAFNAKFSDTALEMIKKKNLEAAEIYENAAKLYEQAGNKSAAASCVDNAGATLNQCAVMLLKIKAIKDEEFAELMNKAKKYYSEASRRFAEGKGCLDTSIAYPHIALFAPINLDPNAYA